MTYEVLQADFLIWHEGAFRAILVVYNRGEVLQVLKIGGLTLAQVFARRAIPGAKSRFH